MEKLLRVSLMSAAMMSAAAIPSQLLAEDRSNGEKDGCFCIEVYQPVCAKLPSGEQKTFSNACFAKCAKATLVHEGPC